MKESIARAVSPIPGSSPDDSNSSPPSSPKRTASPSATSPPLKRSRLHAPEGYNDVVAVLENEDSDEDWWKTTHYIYFCPNLCFIHVWLMYTVFSAWVQSFIRNIWLLCQPAMSENMMFVVFWYIYYLDIVLHVLKPEDHWSVNAHLISGSSFHGH